MKPLLTPPAPGQFGSVYPIPAGQASDSLVQSGTSHGSIGGRVRREFDRTGRVEGGKIGRIGPGEVGVKGKWDHQPLRVRAKGRAVAAAGRPGERREPVPSGQEAG